MTLPFHTENSPQWKESSCIDCSRDRNRSGSCERSDDDYNTIKFTKIHEKEKQHIRSCKVASLLLLTKIYMYARR
jgi:hypothetical protein